MARIGNGHRATVTPASDNRQSASAAATRCHARRPSASRVRSTSATRKPTAQLHQLLVDTRKVDLDRGLLRHENDIISLGKAARPSPPHLAHEALDAISLDGDSDLLGYGDSHALASPTRGARPDEDDEAVAVELAAMILNNQEVRAFAQPGRRRKSRAEPFFARGQRLLLGDRDRQPLAAFAAPRVQNALTTAALHPLAEAVSPLATLVVGLVGALHGSLLEKGTSRISATPHRVKQLFPPPRSGRAASPPANMSDNRPSDVCFVDQEEIEMIIDYSLLRRRYQTRPHPEREPSCGRRIFPQWFAPDHRTRRFSACHPSQRLAKWWVCSRQGMAWSALEHHPELLGLNWGKRPGEFDGT